MFQKIWGRRNYNKNVLYEKYLFSIKEIKESFDDVVFQKLLTGYVFISLYPNLVFF